MNIKDVINYIQVIKLYGKKFLAYARGVDPVTGQPLKDIDLDQWNAIASQDRAQQVPVKNREVIAKDDAQEAEVPVEDAIMFSHVLGPEDQSDRRFNAQDFQTKMLAHIGQLRPLKEWKKSLNRVDGKWDKSFYYTDSMLIQKWTEKYNSGKKQGETEKDIFSIMMLSDRGKEKLDALMAECDVYPYLDSADEEEILTNEDYRKEVVEGQPLNNISRLVVYERGDIEVSYQDGIEFKLLIKKFNNGDQSPGVLFYKDKHGKCTRSDMSIDQQVIFSQINNGVLKV